MSSRSGYMRLLLLFCVVVYVPSCLYLLVQFHWVAPAHLLHRETPAPPASRIHAHVRQSLSKPRLLYNTSQADFFSSWRDDVRRFCDDRIAIHGRKSVSLLEVKVVPERASAAASGGENVRDVMNREETDEFFKFTPGFFQMDCDMKGIKHPFQSLKGEQNHIRDWIQVLDTENKYPVPRNQSTQRVSELTIAVTRYEYANVYWNVMELYDAFLTSQFYKASPNKANLLILDAHPHTVLDQLWTSSFKDFIRLSSLKSQTVFNKLVWNFPRSYSPFLQRNKKYPLLPEFRHFVLRSLNVSLPRDVSERCESGRLNVLFVWRHDYVAHPRNPSGQIQRKITNEDELINATKKAFPHFNIVGEQLDALDIHTQLHLVSQADIFVGMHGAAFGYVVLMTPGRGVVELWPMNHGGNWHMKALADNNSLHYRSWKNTNSKYENTRRKTTYIRPDVMIDLLGRSAKDVCGGKIDLPIRLVQNSSSIISSTQGIKPSAPG